MKKTFKKVLSIAIAAMLVIGMIPFASFTAFATDTATSDPYSGTAATSFTAGDGTADSPYEIDTAEELYYFASLVNGGSTSIHGKLTADIVVNKNVLKTDGTLNGTPIYIWTPIGNNSNKYTGSFDGNSHTVSGLYFNNSSTDYVGLFGYVSGDKVKNLGIKDSYICGKQYVGGVSGYTRNGNTIENCYNTGTVSGKYYVGGVVGCNKGTVTGCYNTGNITSSESYVGGVAGGSTGSVSIVTKCYNSGTITGYYQVGGVVGSNAVYATGYNSSITNCYNTGTVTGTGNYVGGVVGDNKALNSGTVSITNCYNTGTVSGSNYYIGSVVGWNNSGTVEKCYYLPGSAKDGYSTEQKGIGAESMGSTTADAEGVTTATTATLFASGEMAYLMNGDQTTIVFKQTIGTDAYPNFTGDTVYKYTTCDGKGTGYTNDFTPSGTTVAHASYDNGFCIECDGYQPAKLVNGTYEISNAGQLYWFAQQVNNGSTTINGKLTADIVVNKNVLKSDGTLNGTPTYTWTPIGNSDQEYTGTFDGDNHTVSGLYFNNSSTSYVGLFGYIKSGKVQNVGVKDSYFYGDSCVGGVVGYSYTSSSGSVASTSITNCYNTGTVIGEGHYIGGVVGCGQRSTITDCYNTGAVSSSSDGVGGVAGYNDGSITGCYNTGTVSSDDNYSGGVVGYNNRGKIENCYNTGNVTSTAYYVGGVAGYNYSSSSSSIASASVTKCYNTGTVNSEGYYVGGVVGYNHTSGSDNSASVTSCYNTGTVNGEGYYVGGVVGYNHAQGSGSADATNCYNTGTVTGADYYVGSVTGWNNSGTVENCYYLPGTAKDGKSTEQKGIGASYAGGSTADVDGVTIATTTARFSSGEIAYLLNGDQTTIAFKQTIGTDKLPNFTGKTVYYGYCDYCDCQITASIYTNSEPATIVTEENYESLKLSSGYVGYHAIGNADQLTSFANCVNAGNKSADAIVIADIDMTGVTFTPIAPVATLNYSNTTYEDTGYIGTFDGGCHTISNLTITRDSEKQSTVGMFGTVSGTVKNLHLDKASYTLGEKVDGRFSVFVGQLLPGGTITDCVVSNSTVKMGGEYIAGAVAGCNYGGTITNCVSYNNSVDPNARCGNLVGDNQNDSATAVGKVNYCYSTSTLAGGNGGSGTVTNSLSGISGNVVLKIVYLLNSNSDCEWKIKDGVPCFAGDTVYQNTCEGDIFYATNDEDHEAHSLGADFRCTLCGRYDAPTLSGSYYQIATPSNLFWFAEEVNDGNNAIYGQLKNHIDLNNVEWVSIGDTDSPFKGNFDGGNYIISGYKQTITKQGDYGLFGTVNTGNTARHVTIKNFTIRGEAISNIPAGTTGGAFRYGVIGYIFYGTVENVHSSVNLTIKDSNYKDCVGGIVGTSESGKINDTWYWNYIRRCSFSGKLDLGTAQVNTCGGIVGYVGYNSTFDAENCLFDGTIHSDYTSPLQIGGIMGYNRGLNVWFLNCLSVGTIDLANTNFAGAIAGRYLTSSNVVLTKNKVANNYYSGTLPAFSNSTDSSIGYYNIDITDYAEYTEACSKLVTADQLATGEIAYLLQSGNTSQVWGQ